MPKKTERTNEFTFAIKKHLGIVGTTSTGWTKEVNLVEWNGTPAKLDIRDWDPNHEHMGRGITLHKPEALALLEILLRNFGKDLAKSIKSAEEQAGASESVPEVQDEADNAFETAEEDQTQEEQW